MEVISTSFDGLYILKPKVFYDERGYFYESYNQKTLAELTSSVFVQDNQALSQKGILRGLHYQDPPYTQAKLVSVLQGSVLDVVVDLRRSSKTYGQHFKLQLTAEEKNMLLIPEGFAHGYLTLKDHTLFFYKCSSFYHKSSERSILWNDPEIGIEWGITDPVLSQKDKTAIPLSQANILF